MATGSATWTGAVNTTWDEDGNWSPAQHPADTHTATFDGTVGAGLPVSGRPTSGTIHFAITGTHTINPTAMVAGTAVVGTVTVTAGANTVTFAGNWVVTAFVGVTGVLAPGAFSLTVGTGGCVRGDCTTNANGVLDLIMGAVCTTACKWDGATSYLKSFTINGAFQITATGRIFTKKLTLAVGATFQLNSQEFYLNPSLDNFIVQGAGAQILNSNGSDAGEGFRVQLGANISNASKVTLGSGSGYGKFHIYYGAYTLKMPGGLSCTRVVIGGLTNAAVLDMDGGALTVSGNLEYGNNAGGVNTYHGNVILRAGTHAIGGIQNKGTSSQTDNKLTVAGDLTCPSIDLSKFSELNLGVAGTEVTLQGSPALTVATGCTVTFAGDVITDAPILLTSGTVVGAGHILYLIIGSSLKTKAGDAGICTGLNVQVASTDVVVGWYSLDAGALASLTIDAGVTAAIESGDYTRTNTRKLTVNGTYNLNTGCSVLVQPYADDAIVGSANVQFVGEGTPGFVIRQGATVSNSELIDLPGFFVVCDGGGDYWFKATGGLTAAKLRVEKWSTALFDMDGGALTLTGDLELGEPDLEYPGHLKLGEGTHTIGGTISANTDADGHTDHDNQLELETCTLNLAGNMTLSNMAVVDFGSSTLLATSAITIDGTGAAALSNTSCVCPGSGATITFADMDTNWTAGDPAIRVRNWVDGGGNGAVVSLLAPPMMVME